MGDGHQSNFDQYTDTNIAESSLQTAYMNKFTDRSCNAC